MNDKPKRRSALMDVCGITAMIFIYASISAWFYGGDLIGSLHKNPELFYFILGALSAVFIMACNEDAQNNRRN